MDQLSWTEVIDDLFVTTWAKRKPGATEQAFLKTPFIYWLREKGHVEQVQGGRKIEIPLNYGNNETIKWIDKGDTVSLTENPLLTMAEEYWKTVSISVMRWLKDDRENRSKAAAINMVKTKLDTAERNIYEELERAMFADGSGANEPNGLQNIIASDPTTGTLHGINRATSGYEFFRNQYAASAGSAAVYLVSEMRKAFNDVVKYSRAEISDIAMVTNQDVFELYEDVCMDMKVLQNTMMADAGFDTIVFKGKPIMWCPSAPSGNMYFINTNYYKLYCDESYFMEMTNWKEIPNQAFDKAAQIVCTLQAICDRPIVNKVLTGIAA